MGGKGKMEESESCKGSIAGLVQKAEPEKSYRLKVMFYIEQMRDMLATATVKADDKEWGAVEVEMRMSVRYALDVLRECADARVAEDYD